MPSVDLSSLNTEYVSMGLTFETDLETCHIRVQGLSENSSVLVWLVLLAYNRYGCKFHSSQEV